MPQLKKEHVRQAILQAMRNRLAGQGVQGSSLAAVAADAGTSIGNLYRYFDNKEELFTAAIPPDLPGELRTLLREQVEALGTERDASALPHDHPYWRASARTRAFSIEHRQELLFLLRHAEGTPYATFADDVVADFVRLSTKYVRRAYPDLRLTAGDVRALRRIYRAYVRAIADILAEEQSPRALAEATRKLAAYHLTGLQALFTTIAASAARQDESA